jgi:hypothetical protein
MTTYRRVSKPEEEYKAARKRRAGNGIRPLSAEAALPAVYRRATNDNGPLSSADVGTLQRSVGNQTTTQLLSERAVGQAGVVQRALEEEEDPTCPGSKIRSEGQGKGLGTGEGAGPLGVPTEEEQGERYGQAEGTTAGPEQEEWD